MSPNPSINPEDIQILHPRPKSLPFADALFLAGNQHKFQKKIVLLMSLQRICFGFLFTAFPFLFKEPEFQCQDSPDTDYYSCEPTPENCKLGIMPVPGSDNSLITFFELYCDGSQRADLIKTLFTAACSLGVLIIFPLADKLGRRPGLVGSYMLGAVSLLLLGFVRTWWAIAFFLGLAGLGISPYLINSFLILNEFSGAKMRADASVIVNCFWTFGQILVGVLAYLFSNDWSSLIILGIGIPMTLFLPLTILWTKESPMFLVSKKKFNEAKDVLKVVAQTNKRELPEFEFVEEKIEKRLKPETTADRTYGFMDLFRFRSLRVTTLLGSFLCFALYFNYYGTIFALGSVQVNSYVLTIVLAIAELIAYYVSGVMTKKVSRRLSFASCFIACCIANILFAFFPVPENIEASGETPYQIYIQLILSTINRFAVSIAMAISGIYINEIFPTSVRAIGSGLIIFIGRLGSFVATLAISVCLALDIGPIIIFGMICLPAVAISFMIKETQGLPLPECIEEERPNYVEISNGCTKWFDFGYLFRIIQRKMSPANNKEVMVSLKDDFDSCSTSASPQSQRNSYFETELVA